MLIILHKSMLVLGGLVHDKIAINSADGRTKPASLPT